MRTIAFVTLVITLCAVLGLEIVSVLEAADASLRRNGAPIAVGSAARARVAA